MLNNISFDACEMRGREIWKKWRLFRGSVNNRFATSGWVCGFDVSSDWWLSKIWNQNSSMKSIAMINLNIFGNN